MKRILISVVLLAVVACVYGCVHKTAEEENAAQPALRLPLTRVVTRTIYRRVSLPAVVTPLPDHSVKVSSTLAGKLNAVLAQPGQAVAKGQVVALLDPTQLRNALNQAHAKVLQARAGVMQAQTALTLARNTEQRNAELVKMRIGAKKDLIAAQSQVETACAQLVAAQAQVKDALAAEAAARSQLAFTVIRSPIAGTVAQRNLDGGEQADPATPIVVIEDLSQVIVSASLPTTQPATVEPGQPASVEAIAVPGSQYAGVVQGVDSIVQNNGTTIGVRILTPNPEFRLKNGMPVTAVITTAVHPAALTVPSTALVDDPAAPSRKMVYVERHGTISRVHVQVGLQQNGVAEITAGLRPGQPIVAAGAYGLPDGTRVEPAKLAGTPGRIR
jgi:HlyD family secretion protein